MLNTMSTVYMYIVQYHAIHAYATLYYVEHWTSDVRGFTFQSKEVPLH